CLGRADVFAPTDLALREGARMLFELPDRPAPAALDAMAEARSPWRAVAARLLWAYYGARKAMKGDVA
ncbi:MAG: DNA-3-methyladenine glycosylase 2 family protein, partial [Rubrimonas sp.]